MIAIDGSTGEGGGQLLRSSLALSMCTRQPFCIENIRAGRDKPGLMRQHLTAVRAASSVGNAVVEGDAIGSTELRFLPGAIKPGDYHFAVGTAGSVTLVLQTVLPALLTASGPSTLVLEGGTHNPFAPPFDFLDKTFLPIVNRMGPSVTVTLERIGFFPVGGGRIRVEVVPCAKLGHIGLMERGQSTGKRARALVSQVPEHVAEREKAVMMGQLNWLDESILTEYFRDSQGPGNVVIVEAAFDHITEIFASFGARDRSAESVAMAAVKAYQSYIASSAPVGEYLADQLILPMMLAGAGAFRCTGLSRHARTQLELVSRFLDTRVTCENRGPQEGVIVKFGS